MNPNITIIILISSLLYTYFWNPLYIYIPVEREKIDNEVIQTEQRFIEKQNWHESVLVLINHHQDREGWY